MNVTAMEIICMTTEMRNNLSWLAVLASVGCAVLLLASAFAAAQHATAASDHQPAVIASDK
jgi:hypothetical protein